MFQEMMVSSGGGGIPEWQTPTASGSSITYSWGYDADYVVLSGNVGSGVKQIMIFDLNNQGTFYVANSSNNYWNKITGDSRVTATKRSFAFAASSWADNVSTARILAVKGDLSAWW